MGKSKNRELYFERLKCRSVSAKQYVDELAKSPYAVHRRAAKELRPQLEAMSQKAIEELKRKEESTEFKKSLGL